MRKIIICLDGTGNRIGDCETNVLKLYKALDKSDTQICHYKMGVGTIDGQKMLGSVSQLGIAVIGQIFGKGLEDDVLEAFRFLCQNYKSREQHALELGGHKDDYIDDQIYLFGFSRGAYAARMLAGFIHNFGIVKPDVLHLITPVFRAYRRVSERYEDVETSKLFQPMREYAQVLKPDVSVPIRCLGLFDTVSSLIRLPALRWDFSTLKDGSIVEFGTHPNVDQNPSVRIVLHALAVDERRSLFRPQFWRETPYRGNRFRKSPVRSQFVEQRWFPGAHSDVGGSPPENESGIGKIALLWMIDTLKNFEAMADREDAKTRKERNLTQPPSSSILPHGLKLTRGARQRYFLGEKGGKTPGGLEYCGPDPTAKTHDAMKAMPFWRAVEIFPKSLKRRKWRDGRPGFIWYLPLAEPRLIPSDHVIDPSVLSRMEHDPSYDPINVTIEQP